MKTGHKILIILTIIVLVSIFVWFMVNMIGDIPPYDDWVANHVEDLRQIPHVESFYNHYGNEILIWEESGRFYQLGFQATTDKKYSQLIVTFFGGKPYSVTYSCTTYDEGNYESILRITDAKPSEITNCFT